MELPQQLMVSISGARGHAPEVLSPSVAYGLARAFADVMPGGTVIVSRDSRPSGLALKAAVMRALQDAGRDVLDADLIPLPTTQIAIKQSGAAGAIDVTASHNPAEYNGLKFLKGDGTFIDQGILDSLKEAFAGLDEAAVSLAAPDEVPSLQRQAMDWHLDLVAPLAREGRTLRVGVDAVNGAGSFIIPELLERIGCEVIPFAVDPTQPFPHTPEPLPENLVWTAERARREALDFVAVIDPDADRIVFLDEQGQCIPEEATIPLVATELFAAGRVGPVVVNQSSSRMTEDVAAAAGSQVIRSAVGEFNVVAKMKEVGAIFGGEGGGGVIDPYVHTGRDSLTGVVHMVSLLRRENRPLSAIVADLPTYAMVKTKYAMKSRDELAAIYARVREAYPDAERNDEDGLRLTWDRSWVHLRPSNTEPIVRLIAEAPTEEELQELIDGVAAFIVA